MKDEYELEAEFYDRIWGKHDYDADARLLDELFREHGCRRIIDVGCGTGNHALRLSDLKYKVTGVDISPVMLRIARGKDREGKISHRKVVNLREKVYNSRPEFGVKMVKACICSTSRI